MYCICTKSYWSRVIKSTKFYIISSNLLDSHCVNIKPREFKVFLFFFLQKGDLGMVQLGKKGKFVSVEHTSLPQIARKQLRPDDISNTVPIPEDDDTVMPEEVEDEVEDEPTSSDLEANSSPEASPESPPTRPTRAKGTDASPVFKVPALPPKKRFSFGGLKLHGKTIAEREEEEAVDDPQPQVQEWQAEAESIDKRLKDIIAEINKKHQYQLKNADAQSLPEIQRKQEEETARAAKLQDNLQTLLAKINQRQRSHQAVVLPAGQDQVELEQGPYDQGMLF